MKRSLCVIALLFIALLFVGCGGGSSTSSSNKEPVSTSSGNKGPASSSTVPIKAPAPSEDIRNAPQLNFQEVARYPDRNKNKAYHVYGKVLNVSESGKDVMLTVSTKSTEYLGWVEDIIVVNYKYSTGDPRILANDMVNVYGRFVGVENYQMVRGGEASIPTFKGFLINPPPPEVAKAGGVNQASGMTKNIALPDKNNVAFTGKVINGPANLYSTPYDGAVVVGTVDSGKTFPCRAEQNGYFFFNSGGKGWLHKKNVQSMGGS